MTDDYEGELGQASKATAAILLHCLLLAVSVTDPTRLQGQANFSPSIFQPPSYLFHPSLSLTHLYFPPTFNSQPNR